MKYFIVTEHTERNPLPQLTNWFGKISMDDNSDNFSMEPRWNMLDAKIKPEAFGSDILTHPCILMSDKMMKVLQLYQKAIKSKKVVLIDRKNQKYLLYYLAEISKYYLLTQNSTFDKVKSQVIQGWLNQDMINQLSMPACFLLGEISTPTLVLRLDVVESLIRREVRGIHLQELNIV